MAQIKSVSDLQDVNNKSLSSNLIYVSECIEDGKYSSKKMSFDDFFNESSTRAYAHVVSGLHLTSSTENVQTAIDTTNNIISSIGFDLMDQERPQVIFNNPPRSESETMYDNEIPNKREVLSLIQNSKSFISKNSFINADPDNDNGYTKYDPNLYFWHIDHNGNDSTEYIDQVTGRPQSQGVVINESGILTIYGWLASNPTLKPAQAWVGLYAKIKNKNNQSKWTVVSVQPWIIGANSNTMQYVGFNVPVSPGMRFKIKTGFAVNGNVSGLETVNSLTLNGEGSLPNTFVGYVIQ